jgi:hypothetical protein
LIQSLCDLCDKSISLGIHAASKPLFNHQGADPCQRSAFKRGKKRGKRANIGVFNYGKFVAINTLSIHQAGIGSPEDEQLVNMSFKSHAAVSLYQSELYL